MGFLGTIVVFDIIVDVEAEQASERSLTISPGESKATVAGWSYLSKYIIAGHEDGSVSQYDAKVKDTITPHPASLPHKRRQPTYSHPRAANFSTTSPSTKTKAE